MPKISIIIPIYNREKTLRRCINSVLKQTFKDFELILVDDGSTDSSASICKFYCEIDNRIKYIYKENGGVSDARNKGIENATGEFIGFVDADDYIDKDMYKTLYELITRFNTNLSVCSVKEISENEFENTKNIYDENSEKKVVVFDQEDALLNLLVGNFFTMYSVNKLYKKSLFDNIRYPLGRIYEDTIVSTQIFLASKKIAYTSRKLYFYIKTQGSITNSGFSSKSLDVIYAGKYVLDLIKKRFPKILKAAEYRYYWSHIHVVDNMILSKLNSKDTRYVEEMKFIKENKILMLKNPYFNLKRKISLLVLIFSRKLYKIFINKFKSS